MYKRQTWSNGSRGAQRLLAEIVKDPELKKEIDAERLQYKEMLEKRAAIFVEEAKEVGLNILPYKSGFFITLPAKNSAELAEKLAEDNVFVIPLAKAVRFAISAVPTFQVPGLAKRVKNVFVGHEV